MLISFGGLLYFQFSGNENHQSQSHINKRLKPFLTFSGMNKDFNFYGKVVDQYNQPVEGVEFNFHLTYWLFPLEWYPPKIRTKVITDKNGRFSITNQSGTTLYIDSIKKDGYIIDFWKHRGFDFAFKNNTYSFKNKPFIFTTWKKEKNQKKSNLISTEFLIKLIPDGRKYSLNINDKRDNTVNEGETNGNFIISVNRESEKPIYGAPWSVSISLHNGGILESQDKYMYLAPENEYINLWTMEHNNNSKKWKSEIRKNFYVKFNEIPTYGRINLEFVPFYGKYAAINVKYSFDPSGSRNLE